MGWTDLSLGYTDQGRVNGKPRMTRHTVLVVDPEEATSRLIDKVLRKHFDVDVLTVRQSQLAIALFRSRKPWVCIVSAIQNRADGFRLCGALRHLPGGERSTMVVYGRLGDDVEHRDLASEHRLNSWIPAPDAAVLGKVLEPHLSSRVPLDAATDVPPSFSQKHEQYSARVPGTEDKPWVDPDEPPLVDQTWSDVLRADVKGSSIKALLTKEIRLRKKSKSKGK
jgi:CheY-like chemotaxis protein